MDIWTGKVALVAAIVYALASVLSALRMYFVHGRYVHVEFDKKRWSAFGSWAPRQIARLLLMRRIAFALIVIWAISVAYGIYGIGL